MPKVSAGLLPYHWRGEGLEVFLVHPGGPFWANRDIHAWSVAKGEVDQDEELFKAACREFTEETGMTPEGPTIPLGPVRQPGGKLVHVWAIRTELDASQVGSNTVALEWPPRSGQMREFPEIDRAS